MYCENCGAELREGAKFCSKCGSYQGEVTNSDNLSVEEPKVQNTVSTEDEAKKSSIEISLPSRQTVENGKVFFKRILKQPNSIVNETIQQKSMKSVLILIASILLFAVVSCINTSQMIASAAQGLFDTVSSRYPIGEMPEIEVPMLFQLFVPFLAIAGVTFLLELTGINLIAIAHHQRPQSIFPIMNVIATANIAILAGLVINLPLGVLFPTLTIAVFIACLIAHVMFIYRGVCALLPEDGSVIWETTLMYFIISMIFCIAGGILLDNLLVSTLQSLESYMYSLAGDALGGFGEFY